jgi:hypothetical protein
VQCPYPLVCLLVRSARSVRFWLCLASVTPAGPGFAEQRKWQEGRIIRPAIEGEKELVTGRRRQKSRSSSAGRIFNASAI